MGKVQCGPLLPFIVVRGEGGARKTIYGQPSGSQLLFLAGLSIDADGAPNAYHPDDEPGLDALANAGRPGHWWGLATDPRGKPFVQRHGDPYPGFYVSKTTLVDDAVGDIAAPRRYVDARNVPYVVLPGGHKAEKALEGLGAKPGDLAVVYNIRTRKMAAAVWAETGPSDKLGEGSIKLAEMLGYQNTSPRTGGTTLPENLYMVFPGTSLGFPHDLEKIKDGVSDLLSIWGGEERVKDCAEALRRR